jgi:hypothetical protein
MQQSRQKQCQSGQDVHPPNIQIVWGEGRKQKLNHNQKQRCCFIEQSNHSRPSLPNNRFTIRPSNAKTSFAICEAYLPSSLTSA